MAALRFQNVVVLVNRNSGARDAKIKAEELVSLLRESGRNATLRDTAPRGTKPDWRAHVESGVDLLVSVGGDGTLSDVLEHLPRRSLPVGVLPAGTANVLAVDLALPRSPKAFVERLSNARFQLLDVARVNGVHLTFLVTGIGFDARVVREYEHIKTEKKRVDAHWRATKATWSAAGLAAWRTYKPVELSVEIDGASAAGRVWHVLVSNCIHYAGFDVLAHDRVLDDGLYEVYLFRRGSKRALFGYGLRGAFSRFPGGSCERLRARHVRVRALEPVPFEIDGEHALAAPTPWSTPLELEVEPERCTLLVP